MINKLVKRTTGKDIILYHRHYRTQPLANNAYNRKRFLFIDINLIWKSIPFKTADKRKHKIMYFVLNCIGPKYILDINWISKRHMLYKVWTSINSSSKFIALQHGTYAGGIVLDIPHKYIKCDVFLTWSSYFVEKFKTYNSSSNAKVIRFGNSIYNTFDRRRFSYKDGMTNKILLLPTALDRENIIYFNNLTTRLISIGFQVFVKEHYKQGRDKDENNNIKFPSLEQTGVNKIIGSMGSIFPILQENDYDFIIADHSSSLLDAIFFKNKVIYFDPNNLSKGYTTNYSNFLPNLYSKNLNELRQNTFYELINIDNQEALLNDMVFIGNNRIDW